jgi:hypothetical protein
MKNNMRVILSLSVFCFLLVGLTWLSKSSKVQSQSKSKQDTQGQSGVERINAKARAVKGSDKAAIQDLTGEVMRQHGWDETPADLRDSVNDRLVRAEQKFHNGNHKGASETDVARAVNGLVVKFNGPEYAKTSPSEVRELRGRFFPYMPDFIGRGRVEHGKAPAKNPNSQIEEMSPVEAAYTTMAVLHQKLYNPEYQLTQEERRVAWIKKHASTPNSAGQAGSQPSTTATARQQEMEGVLRRAASTPLQDLARLPEKVLDTLGIER